MLGFVSYIVNKEKTVYLCVLYTVNRIFRQRAKEKINKIVLQAKKSSVNEIQSIKIVTNKKLFSFEK